MEGLPCQGAWAFPEDSKNPWTVSKEKTALVRPVSHQYRKVIVLQGGEWVGWCKTKHRVQLGGCVSNPRKK